MDVQFWIYVIIGVIYFLSRLLKKPDAQQGEAPDTQRPVKRSRDLPRDVSPDKPRQLTFEELLREITEGKQSREQQPGRNQEPETYREPRSYEEQPADEARSLEEVTFDETENARIFQAYENAQRQATERRSLEETLRLADTEVKFGKFEAFEQRRQKTLRDDYINFLRNPATLKQAVVMSEILKRKF